MGMNLLDERCIDDGDVTCERTGACLRQRVYCISVTSFPANTPLSSIITTTLPHHPCCHRRHPCFMSLRTSNAQQPHSCAELMRLSQVLHAIHVLGVCLERPLGPPAPPVALGVHARGSVSGEGGRESIGCKPYSYAALSFILLQKMLFHFTKPVLTYRSTFFGLNQPKYISQ